MDSPTPIQQLSDITLATPSPQGTQEGLSLPDHVLLPELAVANDSASQGHVPRVSLRPRRREQRTAPSYGYISVEGDRRPAPPMFPVAALGSDLVRRPKNKLDLPAARLLPMPRHLQVQSLCCDQGSDIDMPCSSPPDGGTYCYSTPQAMAAPGPNLWIPPMA